MPCRASARRTAIRASPSSAMKGSARTIRRAGASWWMRSRAPCAKRSPAMWTARRILKELADTDRRRAILTHFWKHADQQQRMVVQMHLARALNFREETIRKMPPEKKADLLAQRMGAPELEQFLEMALMEIGKRRVGKECRCRGSPQ